VLVGRDCHCRKDRYIPLINSSAFNHMPKMFLDVESCGAAKSQFVLLAIHETSSFITCFFTLVWRSFWCLFSTPLVVNLFAVTRECPGYIASNIQSTASSLTADLHLAGPECNIYGNDLKDLCFKAEYQTGMSPCMYFISMVSIDAFQTRDFMS
jgi:hypothetical protein